MRRRTMHFATLDKIVKSTKEDQNPTRLGKKDDEAPMRVALGDVFQNVHTFGLRQFSELPKYLY